LFWGFVLGVCFGGLFWGFVLGVCFGGLFWGFVWYARFFCQKRFNFVNIKLKKEYLRKPTLSGKGSRGSR
jgi:hypothetical protein